MHKTLLALSLLACCTVNAAITVTLAEVSYDGQSGTMLEFSGSVNTHDSSLSPFPILIGPTIDPSRAQIGSAPNSSWLEAHYVSFHNGPTSFGSGGAHHGTYISGDSFAFGGQGIILLASGYQSGSFIEGASFFVNLTLADIGFAAGQSFEWTWGSGANADKIVLQIVPEPSTVALLTAGAAALLTVAIRRRRNKA